MALTIVRPHANDTVPPDFTVVGLYENADDLVGVLFRVLPKPALVFGKLTVAKAGTWSMSFHLDEGPFGKYVLAVTDAKKGTSQFVPLVVAKRKRSARLLLPPFRATYPTASGTFHSDDIAEGFAVVSSGTPDPNLTATITFNDATQTPGTVSTAPTAANSYHWGIQFNGLPTTKNPVTLQVTSDQHPNVVTVGNVTIIANAFAPKKKAVKKKAKEVKAKK